MTVAEIELTEEYKQWEKDLLSLNDRINAISPWNDYAESLQSEYDHLMFVLDPRKKAV